MIHCTFELNEELKELCSMVPPHGKFQCCCMAMGSKVAQDLAQHCIEKALMGSDVEMHIDCVGVFGDSFDEHVAKPEAVSQ